MGVGEVDHAVVDHVVVDHAAVLRDGAGRLGLVEKVAAQEVKLRLNQVSCLRYFPLKIFMRPLEGSSSTNYGWKPQYMSGGAYHARSYGSTFGPQGLHKNTYIYNNQYGGQSSSGQTSPYLSNAFYTSGNLRRSGYNSGSWNDEDDRNWRATTKSPYFNNKLPG